MSEKLKTFSSMAAAERSLKDGHSAFVQFRSRTAHPLTHEGPGTRFRTEWVLYRFKVQKQGGEIVVVEDFNQEKE